MYKDFAKQTSFGKSLLCILNNDNKFIYNILLTYLFVNIIL